MAVKLKFKKLDERAVIPTYAHKGDIGLDVTAIDVEYDEDNDLYIYHTGLACEMEEGYALLCLPHSSNTKTNAYLPNSPGLVDPATYRGEIQWRYKLRDVTTLPTSFFHILDDITQNSEEKLQWIMNNAPYKVGDRIGQFVVVQVPQLDIEEVDELSETERGTGAWGSSGK